MYAFCVECVGVPEDIMDYKWIDHPVLLFLDEYGIKYSRYWAGSDLCSQLITLSFNQKMKIFIHKDSNEFSFVSKRALIRYNLVDPECFDKLIKKFKQFGMKCDIIKQ